MDLSRRDLLRHIGASVAVATTPSLAHAALRPEMGAALPDNTPQAGAPVRLCANENAYGPSRKVIAAMCEAASTVARHYPQAESEALASEIAAVHRVSREHVVLGCGSREILQMAADAFLRTRKKLLVARPTCDVISSCAARAGAEVVAVPLSREYSHDLQAMLSATDAATGLVYICNPNNPTGTLTPRHDLEAFLRKLPATTFVLIDEAYHHYVEESRDNASFLDDPIDDSRVLVARSFSKIYGLAGLRVGYAIAAPRAAHLMASGGLPLSVNGMAAIAAAAALSDHEHVRTSAMRNADDRQEFFNNANARMLRVIDSKTNFVMVNTGRSASTVIEHFTKNGVLLPRPFLGFDTYIRVSLGTPAEMREFWRVWDLMPVHNMHM